MERLFIETKYEGEIRLPKDLISELPEKIILASTVQFVENLVEVKRKLEAYKKEVYFFKGIHGRYSGQILGCDNFKVSSGADAFLYIGDGEFHPKALLVNEKPVFCFNHYSGEVKRLGRKEWEELKLKKKAGLMKLGSANNIGIVISTKEGQKEMQGKADELKKKLCGEGKKVYLFLCDEIKEDKLKDFNFIDCWINTACPRISDDVNEMVNLKDL